MLKINIKSEENVSAKKIAFWYVICNFITIAIGNLTTPIFARIMSTSDYGKFSNFMTWQNLLLIFFSLSLVTSLGRAKFDYSTEIEEYLSTMVLLGNIVGIVIWGVIEIGSNYFTVIFNMDMAYVRIMLLDILFMPSFLLLQSFFRIYNKYKFFIFFSLFSASIRTFMSIILILLMEDKFQARVIGYVVPNILMNVLLWLYVICIGKRFKWEYCIYALPIALPMVANSLAGNILISSDRIMITKYCGEGNTALYTMAISCSTLANVLWTALNQAWTPWLFDKLHDKNYMLIKKKSKELLNIYFFLMISMMLILPEILWFFGGTKYMGVLEIVPIIFISVFCQFVYGLYMNVETYIKKTYYSMIGTGIAAIVNVGLNIFAIPKWGYMAAAYTTFVGYLLLAILHTVIIFLNKEYRGLYDTKYSYFLLGILLIYSELCKIIYDNILVRYSMIFIYALVGIFFAYIYITRRKIIK